MWFCDFTISQVKKCEYSLIPFLPKISEESVLNFHCPCAFPNLVGNEVGNPLALRSRALVTSINRVWETICLGSKNSAR